MSVQGHTYGVMMQQRVEAEQAVNITWFHKCVWRLGKSRLRLVSDF